MAVAVGRGPAMNLAQLEYFEAVYARRSYATAAKDIPMSHQGLLKKAMNK